MVVRGCTLMSFLDLISLNFNIINKNWIHINTISLTTIIVKPAKLPMQGIKTSNINKTIGKQNNNIQIKTLRIHTILYHTYLLLYFKQNVHMTSNHSNTNLEKNNRVNKITITHSIYFQLILHNIKIFNLLHFKGHTQMISNRTKHKYENKSNIVNKIIQTHSITSKFILEYSY